MEDKLNRFTSFTSYRSVPIRFANKCSELVLEISAVSVKVKKIIVMGKWITPELEHANQVVDQLCKDIFPATQSNHDGP